MASAIYPKFKEVVMQGGLNLSSLTIKAALVDTGTYTYSAAHQYYSSVTGVVGTPQTIANKTFTDGKFNGDDVTFTAVTGNSVEAVIVYNDTGTAGTSNLIAYIEFTSVTPNGGNIGITWDNSNNYIFQL